MRLLAPKDAAVYLEVKDLSETIEALTDNRIFLQNAVTKPDLSALENIQVAVVIDGFDASEKQVSDDNSILDFKPKFVVVADTHTWHSTAVSIAENQIGNFARRIFGDNDVKLEAFEKGVVKFFVWTSRDGRKLFSAVSKSVIHAGNDEALLEKCLAVERGEAESLTTNEKFNQTYERINLENLIAFGYVAPEGIKQFAEVAGVSTAVEASDRGEERTLITRILPRILQNTTEEIVWTARKNEGKIEDEFSILLNDKTASLLNETFAPSPQNEITASKFLPADVSGFTEYNLKNSLTAWRGMLLVAGGSVDSISKRILIDYSDQLLAPYGISNAEMFLSAVDSKISTVQFDAEGASSAVIADVGDAAKLKESIGEINFRSPPEKRGDVEVWKSESGEFVAAFIKNKLILGDGESVLKCLQAQQSGQYFTGNQNFQKLAAIQSTAVTYGRDSDSAGKIISVLGNVKAKNQNILTEFITETRFTDRGIERKTISDFGTLGTVLEQLSVAE